MTWLSLGRFILGHHFQVVASSRIRLPAQQQLNPSGHGCRPADAKAGFYHHLEKPVELAVLEQILIGLPAPCEPA